MSLTLKITLAFLLTGLALAALVVAGGPAAAIPLKLILFPVIAGLAGYMLSRAVCHEISILQNDIDIARKGNVSYKPSISMGDEIGRVSATIDEIMKELREKTLRVAALEDEVSRRNKSIKELKQGEERFRRLFEQSNDAMFIYDFESKIVNVNNKACEMMGYAREQLLAMSFLDLHTEEELSRIREARVVRSATASSLRFESEFKKSDGSAIAVEISSSTVDRKNGIMQAVVTNITERKGLEKALKESEEKFRTFMETASDFMYIADRDGRLNYVNEAMFNALGYTGWEMIGMSIANIMDKDTKAVCRQNRFDLSKKGEITYEAVWEARNRRKLYGEMKEVSIYDANGIFSGSRGVFRDTSERKKIEKAQRLANLGELAADVAHEVNNPVMIISARAELLLMDAKQKKERESLETILDQCEKAKGIVQRLLKFSKPSKGDFKPADVNAALEGTVKLVEQSFFGNNVKVIRKYADGIPAVNMDEKLMQEVFINLLKNAQEAMPEGGTITIYTSKEDDSIRIDFKDTGSGISEEDMKNIFDPFFTTKEQGTGLGLSVCYGIVKAHGGELKYSSEGGKGTTATILLSLLPQRDK